MKENSNICRNRRIQKTLLILMILLVVCVFSVDDAFSEGPENQDAGSIRIDFQNGTVSADIRNAPLSKVLAALAKKTGILIDGAADLEQTVNISVSKISLEDFLALLCQNRALVFERIPATDIFRVIGAGTYKSREDTSKGFAAARRADDAASSAGTTERRNAAVERTGARISAPLSKETDSQGRPLYKAGEILVRFKSDASSVDIVALHRRLESRVLDRLPARRLEKIAVAKDMSEDEAVARYLASDLVENAERHALRYPMKVPDDPLFDQQWGLSQIRAPGAWQFTTGDSAVVVAVIDSGVDYLHPDLDDNIWVNLGWDFGGALSGDTSDGDGYPTDSAASGHGTHVAGIIAAKGNNGEGVSGTAWQLQIMALKVKADDSEYFELFHVIEALDYARLNGAKIVNCSFGGETNSTDEQNAFQDLEEAGILAVCAAGNGGVDLDAPGNELYPAEYDLDNILTVAATTQTDSLAYFSNYGLTAVDAAAPGVSIKTTTPVETVTEASVIAGDSTFTAIGMLYAGTTGDDGVAGTLFDCGKGYEDEFPKEFTAGDIALIERGNRDGNDFYFSEKVSNAQGKRAAAVIIYNNRVDDLDQNGGTLGAADGWIPAVSVTQADGIVLKSVIGQSATVINRVPDTAYAYNQGTSMAAPFVSGLAGLLWSKEPTLTYAQVKSAIIDTVDKISALKGKLVSGGRINTQGALCSINALKGDLNCDGQVGLADAVYVAQILSGKSPYVCRYCLSTGTDPVGDGAVTVQDVIYLLQGMAGQRP